MLILKIGILFFSKLGKKSSIFHWDKSKFRPLRTPKKKKTCSSIFDIAPKQIKHCCLLKERLNLLYILWGITKHTRFQLFYLVFFIVLCCELVGAHCCPITVCRGVEIPCLICQSHFLQSKLEISYYLPWDKYKELLKLTS